MNNRLGRWAAGVTVVIVACSLLLWQHEFALKHRRETLALARVLQTCQTEMRKIHDPSLRLAMDGKRDYFFSKRRGSQVEWILVGSLFLNNHDAFFECDATEDNDVIQVEFTESAIFWTPPPD